MLNVHFYLFQRAESRRPNVDWLNAHIGEIADEEERQVMTELNRIYLQCQGYPTARHIIVRGLIKVSRDVEDYFLLRKTVAQGSGFISHTAAGQVSVAAPSFSQAACGQQGSMASHILAQGASFSSASAVQASVAAPIVTQGASFATGSHANSGQQPNASFSSTPIVQHQSFPSHVPLNVNTGHVSDTGPLSDASLPAHESSHISHVSHRSDRSIIPDSQEATTQRQSDPLLTQQSVEQADEFEPPTPNTITAIFGASL